MANQQLVSGIGEGVAAGVGTGLISFAIGWASSAFSKKKKQTKELSDLFSRMEKLENHVMQASELQKAQLESQLDQMDSLAVIVTVGNNTCGDCPMVESRKDFVNKASQSVEHGRKVIMDALLRSQNVRG